MATEHILIGLALAAILVNFFAKTGIVLPCVVVFLGVSVIATPEVDTWLIWVATILVLYGAVTTILLIYNYIARQME